MVYSSEEKECIEKGLYTDIYVIELNNNRPAFTADDEKQLEGDFKPFSDLNEGRCGVAFASISKSTLSSNRDKIQSKPAGFPESEEKNVVNKRFIFHRCHLIGYRLLKKTNDEDKENANLKRIFTGTRFMNNEMLYYEKRIAEFVKKNKERQVIYRVTPYYKGENTVAYGVKMEAKFLDENNNENKDLSFNVFVYNKQPDIIFKYENGEILRDESINLSEKMSKIDRNYIINKRSKRFHLECCASAHYMDNERKQKFFGKREDLINGNNIKLKCYSCAICDSGIK